MSIVSNVGLTQAHCFVTVNHTRSKSTVTHTHARWAVRANLAFNVSERHGIVTHWQHQRRRRLQ